jgi:hypothetical protein
MEVVISREKKKKKLQYCSFMHKRVSYTTMLQVADPIILDAFGLMQLEQK